MSNLSRLHTDVCFKRSQGKIIWQPRIDCWIDDRKFANGELPGIYKDMKKSDIYRSLGCSARAYEFNECFKISYTGGITTHIQEEGEYTTEFIHTPLGTVTHISKYTPSSWARLDTKEWVETEEDLKIFTYIEQNTQWHFDEDFYNEMLKEWGDLGAPCIFMPRVSIQRLYIDLMGVENAVYAVYDYEDTVLEYFNALRECHFRMIDVINDSPIMLINFGDNIHSGTLSPEFFKRYVLKEYKLRCERLHLAGKFVYSHFDGDNRGLMEYYRLTGLDGIEAITPKPQGDVTLEEAKEHLGDMVMIDGIPAVYFDETYSEDVLIECVHKVINLFAPNLVLGISDEISSTGDIERIRLVGEIVDEYNSKIEERENEQ